MRRYNSNSSTAYEFGKARGASRSPGAVYDAVQAGVVTVSTRVMQEGERIDVIAGEEYGDSTLWWIIAAASGIGWVLQAPPGTRLVIPNFQQISRIV